MLEDFHLYHLARSVADAFRGDRPTRVEVTVRHVLRFRWQERPQGLLLSLHPSFPAIFSAGRSRFAGSQRQAATHPLQEHLAGLPLVEVGKLPDERILFLDFGHGGDRRRLYLELRPIAPGLWLCDPRERVLLSQGNGPVVDAVYRLVPRPGREEATVENILSLGEAPGPGKLARRIRGLSPTLVEEGLTRAGDGDPERMARSLVEVVTTAYRESDDFHLYTRYPLQREEFRLEPRVDFRLASFPLLSCEGWSDRSVTDPAEAVATWLTYALDHEVFASRRQNLVSELGRQVRESESRIHSMEEQLAQADKADIFRKYGELILAHLHRFGADHRAPVIRVPDFYEDGQPEIDIPLVPERTLRENADTYFRRYRKARIAVETLPPLLDGERARLARWRDAADRAASAVTMAVVTELEGRLPRRRSKQVEVTLREKQTRKNYQFRRYETRGGLTVLVGRNAADNDRLTFRVARPDDVWFHVADYHGSHVVLVWGRKTDPPLEDLLDAAGVAAWYSEARKSPVVDVNWTHRKHVHKIKGTPGLVRLMKHATLRVPPGVPAAADSR